MPLAHARGQATSGSISGFVTDNTAAAIPQAKVSVKDEGTESLLKLSTDGSGFYNVTHLIAGTYTVTVTANGFKTFTKQHILLQIDSAVKADAHLDPGMLTEQVTVTAAPAALKTEKTDVDHCWMQHEIETVPVSDDNLTTLYLTAPGVVPFSFQISTNENPSEGFMTSVNGQLWMANDYQVDGITDIAWGFTGLQIIVPPPDSVQELKITTADYDPEYGSVGGMVAQYDTKSGTNDIHGSAYWMNRNAWSFAANPFTEKIPGTGPQGRGAGVAPYNENIGGVAIGGPIKKNKVFFFADYRLNRRLVGANCSQRCRMMPFVAEILVRSPRPIRSMTRTQAIPMAPAGRNFQTTRYLAIGLTRSPQICSPYYRMPISVRQPRIII